ncbi:hypothetical protein ILUMI_26213 [Ignelater luminosus]|uniref:LIM zinc-binding domain-containing protein n=1 Tax=Ignelater luminosus TaxID=2038154 RepID=A0A8K0FZ57_IGNLU|nr:hypothetical protein ILUMI_26213 [Ignelater luminosus]
MAPLARKLDQQFHQNQKKPQPQVPYSHTVKQAAEPLYSSRLPSANPALLYSNLPPPSHAQTLSNMSTLPIGSHSHYNNTYANVPKGNSNLQYSNVRASPNHSNYQNSELDNTSNLRDSNLSLASNSNLSHSSLPLSSNFVPKAYAKPDQHVMYSNIQVGQVRNNDGLIYSNLVHPPRDVNVYSNLPPAGSGVYANGDDLPPPPPPPELTASAGDYAPCTVNTNLPPPPDDLPPPPSPVSSSYSELRRATLPGQDYPNYGIGSQASSTYESIYEPINPRPPSQMSSRSNYSLYAPYVSGGSNVSGPSQSASRVGVPKEQEVDALTDLLVQGMEDNVETDFYGMCVKCGEKVVGENSGCTAMDKIYHTKCFTCHHCAVNLQGKPFYSLDGKPYCEEDYLNTLEKCCVCTKPILDRILRATGKPYHPKCFCCVICGKSLDGIPFTVDATNQIHCIEDFHKKFAPRCCVCKQPIMPEPGQEETVRVVALDRSFHIQCYKCEDCGLVLSSEAEGRGCYPLDDHVLCKSCNAKRVQALTRHMTTEL